MKKILIMFVLLFLLPASVYAQTYYVDATGGNNLNDGLSEGTAWKTISKVNSMGFSPGDNILFKRGEVWREQLIVPSSGAPGNPITFGAYGTGDLPKIYGSTQVSTWTYESGNLWYASYGSEPISLCFINTDGSIEWGDKKSNKVDLAEEYDWWWDSGNSRIYVYTGSGSGNNPDTKYTSIEAPTRDYGIYCLNKDYVTISNFEVAFAKSINIFMRNYNTQRYGHVVEYCDAHHPGSKGGAHRNIVVTGNNNCIIRHNKAHHGWTGIKIEAKDNIAADDCIVEYNEIYDNYHAHFDLFHYGTGTSCDGHIFRYNVMYCTDDFDTSYDVHGFFTQGNPAPKYITNVKCYYNIAYNNNGNQFVADSYTNGLEFYNNIVVGSHPDGFSWVNGFVVKDTGLSNIKLKNNICTDQKRSCLHVMDSAAVTECDYNCWYNPVGIAYVDVTGKTNSPYTSSEFSTYKSETGWDTHGLWEDPKFFDKANNNFHLASNSPCIDSGTDVGLTQDFEGNTVPQGSAPDIGAYEYQGTVTGVYYVDKNDPGCSDSNPGTESLPWCTIQKAADTMIAGDTVIVKAGTYDERITESTSGSSGNLITFQVNPGDTVQVHGFTLTGDYIKIDGFNIDPPATTVHPNRIGVFVNGDYNEVWNCYIYQAPKTGILIATDKTNCKIMYNHCNQCGGTGITMQGKNCLVEGNEIEDSRCSMKGNSGSCDGMHAFNTNNTYRGNYIHGLTHDNNPGEPHIDCFQTWKADTRGGEARNSTFEKNRCWIYTSVSPAAKCTGFQLESAHDLIIKNNIVKAFHGIHPFQGPAPEALRPHDITIVNNIIIGDLTFNASHFPGGISVRNSDSVTIKNNIICEYPTKAISWLAAESTNVVAEHNLAYNSDGSTPGYSGFTPGPTDLWGINPKLVNLVGAKQSGGDEHLQSNSPAIDAGADLSGIVDYDYDDVSRPQGSGYDIGAYEYSGPTGNVYYVSTTGNDNNPGTESLPWRTIQKAADTMVAGDTVIVLDGDYSDEKVRVYKSGTIGAPITYQAQGNVKVKGFLVAALYTPTYDTDNADYITIRGFEIVNTEDPVPGVDDWRMGTGIFMEGSHCIIENNVIHYSTWGGITLFKQNGNVEVPEGCIVKNNLVYQNGMNGIGVFGRNNLIENNEVWGTLQHHPNNQNQKDVGWLDADGMRFFGQGHIFRGNYIHDITFGPQGGNSTIYGENINPHIDCFQTWNNQEPTSNITFEKNFCDVPVSIGINGNGHAFMLESASYLTIRNNIIKAYGGINTGSTGTNHHLTIVNNIFANNLSFTPFPGGVGLNSCPYTIVKNNIFYDQPSHTITSVGDATGNEIDYNLAYNSDGSSADCLRVADYVCQNPSPNDLWDIDPQFVNPSSDDFHLQQTSPAIDNGITLTEVTEDYEGNLRPQGSGYDIGAYEFTGTPTPPLLPGLSWEAEDGVITPPFMVENGYVYQTVDTDPSSGGKASYRFNIDNPGDYIIKTIVNASGGGTNSFFVNIDAEPTSPYMIWDVDITNDFEERNVSWRGSGTFDNNEFVPKIFTLTAGEHELIIRGREPYTLLDNITLEPFNCPNEDGDGYDTCDPGDPGDDGLPADCDDTDININPGATEDCNDVDDNCVGGTDEGFTNENCKYVCENNGYVWLGWGDPLSCCGNHANEDGPYEDTEVTCDDGNDNDCDGSTDSADSDCGGGGGRGGGGGWSAGGAAPGFKPNIITLVIILFLSFFLVFYDLKKENTK